MSFISEQHLENIIESRYYGQDSSGVTVYMNKDLFAKKKEPE